jgi:hypothetical protein
MNNQYNLSASNKLLLTTLIIMLAICSYAQNGGIIATNEVRQKEVFFKEDKRIRITMVDGKKIKGKFSIVDTQHIKIKEHIISLKDLISIKRNPQWQSIGLNGLLMYAGAVTMGISVIIATVVAEYQALWLIIPGYGLTYAGATSMNVLKAYKTKKGWFYTIHVP